MRGDLKKVLLRYPDKLLSTVLWLVALHSIAIGLVLIAQPALLMKLSGFSPECERFFPAQGGVFHILMAVAYVMGATNIKKYHYLIVFSIIVKAVATLFLMVYCFTIEFKWIVLLSGIGDGIMGLIIFLALQNYLPLKTPYGNRYVR
ncbi:MAG: hypothetical protein OEL58_08150 [Desulfobacteraceae bacterium]|nr:hypothetical protein [Desulfobacteraceae bacterium]